MKILKLLNKKFINSYNSFFFVFNVKAEDEPIDIWNIDQNEIQKDKVYQRK